MTIANNSHAYSLQYITKIGQDQWLETNDPVLLPCNYFSMDSFSKLQINPSTTMQCQLLIVMGYQKHEQPSTTKRLRPASTISAWLESTANMVNDRGQQEWYR